jgi:hypothetical protein
MVPRQKDCSIRKLAITKTLKWLRKQEIKAILDLTEVPTNLADKTNEFTYLNVPMLDHWPEPLMK